MIEETAMSVLNRLSNDVKLKSYLSSKKNIIIEVAITII